MRHLLVYLLVSLLALQMLVEAYQSGSSSVSTSSITSSIIRLRGNKLRKPELCRENLPKKSEDLPNLVITGRVREVYLAGEPTQTTANTGQPNSIATSFINVGTTQPTIRASDNKALVTVIRVFKGNRQLVGSDIIISGFNSSNSTPCPNYVKPNDTWILLLNQLGDRKYAIQDSNILSLNLNNLDRIDAISKDEPLKRRPPIENILCEAHYCVYGRCAVINEARNQVSCQCPDTCPPLPAPVCGSDNTTYTNECHLIQEGCRRQRPLFVTKESSC